MYRKQMTFQKIVCLCVLIAGALVFIYALGMVTDLYDSLYYTMYDPNDFSMTDVPGSIIYYDVQDFNHQLLIAALGMIVVSLLLFFTSTNTRRRYYVGNYFAIGVNAACGIGVTVWALPQILSFREQYLTTVDFEALKSFSEMWKTLYTESTFWFDISQAVFGFVILTVVLSIVNLIWKLDMMKTERRLIEAGKRGGAVS